MLDAKLDMAQALLYTAETIQGKKDLKSAISVYNRLNKYLTK
jgi:hypothetical protein